MNKLTLALVLSLAAACGDAPQPNPYCSTTSAVVDGRLATADETYSTVKVGPGCTGTLVAPTVVITAAHCHQGAGYVTQGTAIVSVWDRIVHPDYAGTGTANDIEVLILDTPLPGPYATIAHPAIGEALVTGYGADNACHAGTLRIGTSHIDAIGAGFFTTSAAGAGSCYGDSGGPLYQGGHLVGVTSHGRGGLGCGGGSVNVTPADHAAWLDTVTGGDITFAL